MVDLSSALALGIPILAVVIGWWLNELSQSLRVRRSARGALGRAIVDLLELRLRLIAQHYSLPMVSGGRAVDPVHEAEAKAFLASVLPSMEHLTARYEEAMHTVAEADPALAYDMRSKDQLPQHFERLRSAGKEIGFPPAAIARMEVFLVKIGIDDLGDTTLKLARRHSWITWWRVRHRLGKQTNRPPALGEAVATLGLGE